jgi:NAD(P)-dependent dehydrogenase (short-subunit alcohol dehydrogenase family)
VIRFDGQAIVITGAGNGLGKDYAIHLASRGAHVIVNDASLSQSGQSIASGAAELVATEIRQRGGVAIANSDDVSSREGAINLVSQCINQFGRVDALVCNAGFLRDKSLAKMALDDFEAVVRVHLYGTLYPLKAAYPFMREANYGRIVFASSFAGLYGNHGQSNYAAAKMAVIGLMNSLKLEAISSNILVNTIAPIASTRLAGSAFEKLALLLRTEFVTPMVSYLCSKACTTTGAVLSAGGGHFSGAQMMEGEGMRFETANPITPEMIADHYAQIISPSHARQFISGEERVKHTIEPLMRSSRQ